MAFSERGGGQKGQGGASGSHPAGSIPAGLSTWGAIARKLGNEREAGQIGPESSARKKNNAAQMRGKKADTPFFDFCASPALPPRINVR